MMLSENQVIVFFFIKWSKTRGIQFVELRLRNLRFLLQFLCAYLIIFD